MLLEQRARIRVLNDQLRQGRLSGRIAVTRGVAALGKEAVSQVFAAMAAFNEFSPDNDPYGEHDLTKHCFSPAHSRPLTPSSSSESPS